MNEDVDILPPTVTRLVVSLEKQKIIKHQARII